MQFEPVILSVLPIPTREIQSTTYCMAFVNLFDFASEHAASLSPPVCNKMIFNLGKLRIMIIGGPNQRKDYHLNLGEEIFYQVRGSMTLKVMECNEPRDVVIQEGEFFVLPGSIAHSPQRFEDTLGIVIERARADNELDGLRYYVDDSNKEILWQRFFHVTDLGSQLVPLIKEFFASEEFSSRKPSPSMPEAAWEVDHETLLPSPFVLAQRFSELHEGRPPLRLANKEFIVDLVSAETKTPALPIETEVWVWLLTDGGEVVVNSHGEGSDEESRTLTRAGDTVLLVHGLHELSITSGARALVIYTTGV